MFGNIGNVLKEKYKSAIKVTVEEVNSRQGKLPKFLVLPGTNFVKSPEEKLVFQNKSPNYCEANAELGIAGTSGRKCDLSKSTSNGGCEPLCCGRGYDKIEFIEDVYCHCQFHYCCFRVQCNICKKKSQATICK